MATNSLRSSLNHRKPTPPLSPRVQKQPSLPTTLSLNHLKNNLVISTTLKTFSLSPSSTTSSSTSTNKSSTSFDLLTRLLSANDFREADNETRRLLIALAGAPAQKRGYIFFSELQFINQTDLIIIDQQWRNNSNNKFGYTVQKRLWEKCDKNFTKFFIKVGWMKKLDTEVVQYNYRAFPDEFVWELNGDTLEGHLPLTNALRGTQLLTAIFTHPAFVQGKEDDEVFEEKEKRVGKLTIGKPCYIS